MMTVQRRAIITALLIAIGFAVIGVLFWWLWGLLSGYIQPKTPTDRKDLVNVFVLMAAGGVGALTALAAVGNLMVSRRNLQQQRDSDNRRAQDDALQAYYKQMGDLLTDHDLKKVSPDSDVALLGRAQTLTVLRRLDARRKSDVVLFLYGAGLINKDGRIVDLRGADLSGADLHDTNLHTSAFSAANLSHANLANIFLRGAALNGANLSHANLSGAKLSEADLAAADFISADLRRAYLRDAYLGNANFAGADLSEADLRDANLGISKAVGANLSGANLSKAEGLTDEQIAAANSLEGATMPNGQKYEDWRKDKAGSGEDGENE